MTEAERGRFHNLLVMARESPFEGERNNALCAAQRLADSHGMTLEEAARSDGAVFQETPVASRRATEAMVKSWRDAEAWLRRDKERLEKARAAARARGLDAKERRSRKKAEDGYSPSRSQRCRSPLSHARVLLTETRLPLAEIATIAGLDIWTVVGLKLKLRTEMAKP